MKKPKVAVYMRVGSPEQLNKAWIFERRNNGSDRASLDAQMEEFRKLCKRSGYTIAGETIVTGGSEASLPAIRSILSREKDLQYLLCPSARSVSRNLDELFAAVDYLKEHGVTLKYRVGSDLVGVPDAFRNLPRELLDSAERLDEERGIEEADGPRLSM